MQVGNRSQFPKVIFASSTEESLRKNTANTFCSSDAGKEAKVCRNWGAYWLYFLEGEQSAITFTCTLPMGFVSTCLRIAKRRTRKKTNIEASIYNQAFAPLVSLDSKRL